MNNNEIAELDAMSGSSQQTTQLLKLDEVQLNGKDGIFVIKRKTQEKVKEGDRDVYPKEEHSGKLSLLFLKKRRVLIERGKGGTKVRETNEHNTPSDVVTLYNREAGTSETGVAKDLRVKYPNLRTNEVIYAQNLVNGDVVRLIIRGSSLHMQEEVKGITLLYDYLQSFTGDDKFYLYETDMTPTPVKTPLGTVYTTHFSRGRKITDEEFKTAAEHIRRIHANTKAADAVADTQVAMPVASVAKHEQDIQTIDYGDELANPDDIPF